MKHEQRMVIADAVLSIVIIIVVLQLWLFTATMEQYLGGDRAIIVPAQLEQGPWPSPEQRRW